MSERVVVVGAGVLGLTAALELRRRGLGVALVDAGRIPEPGAASTDISKACRMEYGSDRHHMALMERARDGWLAWNERWAASGGAALYTECGVVMVARAPMEPGGFEHDSWQNLLERGYRPERLDAAELARRFPAWSTGRYVDGFFHARGGYAQSGRVLEALLAEARAAGVEVHEERPIARLVATGGRTSGVVDRAGGTLEADAVVVSAGSWTHELLARLRGPLRASGHAVFHLRPSAPDLFAAERFPVFTADIAHTGFYGFPLHPEHGVVKVALHDLGVALEADTPREVTAAQTERLRAFLADTFPDLADAEVVYTRLCPYSDTQDEDFWIARDPTDEGLTVAAGGSGHAFKFAPVLGELVADAAQGRANPALERYRWRDDVRLDRGREEARCHER